MTIPAAVKPNMLVCFFVWLVVVPTTRVHAQTSPNILDPRILNVSTPTISYVMEPFELVDYDQEWFVAVNGEEQESFEDEEGMVNITISEEDVLFGNASLRVECTAPTTTTESTTTMTFGWIQPDKPHNCFGADHLSLWYKLLSSSTASEIQLQVTLLDDSHCGLDKGESFGGICPSNETGVMGDLLEQYSYIVSLPAVEQDINATTDWQELRMEAKDLLLLTEQTVGNEQLNWNRLRGWKVDLIVANSNNNTSEKGKDNTIAILFDQLACVGSGDMLGASFHQGSDITWSDGVQDGLWIEEYYQSNISYDESNVILDPTDGKLQVNYTVQMVETWGGFVGLTFLAPGPAYYNLTGASDWHLGYRARVAASVPGRTHLRIVVSEVSHCSANCSTSFVDHERWYSFHYVLDDNITNDGYGEIYMPLVGSTEPDTPLWLTGWNGDLGNSQLDIAYIKGFTLEFNIDSQGDMNSTVSGALDMFDMSALSVVRNETVDLSMCIVETGLYLKEMSPLFERKEFVGDKCCEVCQEDETCLYALTTGRDCYIASYVNAGMVGIINTEIQLAEVTAFWMDDVTRRGDFCDLCDCREDDLTIDCSGRDLLIVPKTFYQDNEDEISWYPRVLDLRNNSNLVILGQGSLDSIAQDLEELFLPKALRHISLNSVKDLPVLSEIHFEDPSELDLSNVIVESSGAFGEVCCTQGDKVDTKTPQAGLTFCNMQMDQPGIDATYFPFFEFQEADRSSILKPSSSFMGEAAESVEKCAEYCAISSECKYFQYDARLPNAEHECHLLLNNGTGPLKVCCDEDHFADVDGTLPGWTSGLPPRTRHDVDNACVVVEPSMLALDPDIGYQTEYEVSLGSMPLRGAVWIEPRLASYTSLKVTFSPARVVLYDANSTATVVVKVSNVITDSRPESLVVNNIIRSCDVAFIETRLGRAPTVFIDVDMPQSDTNSNLGVVIAVSVAVVIILALGIYLYMEQKRKAHDSVWKVKQEELTFADPPEVLGRGTFGLVLKATYRGTDVAVKRVIPPKERKPRGRLGSVNSVSSQDKAPSATSSFTGTGSMLVDGKASGTSSMRMSTSTSKSGMWGVMSVIYGRGEDSSYAKLKKDFMEEMRHLSKVCHFDGGQCRVFASILCYIYSPELPSYFKAPPSLHHDCHGGCHQQQIRANAHHGVHGTSIALNLLPSKSIS